MTDRRKEIAARKLREKVIRLVCALGSERRPRDGKGWTPTSWLTSGFHTTKRTLCVWVEASGGQIIARRNEGGGYKLTKNATPSERSHASAVLRAQANVMLGHATRIDAVGGPVEQADLF